MSVSRGKGEHREGRFESTIAGDFAGVLGRLLDRHCDDCFVDLSRFAEQKVGC